MATAVLRSDTWDPLFGVLGMGAIVAAAFGLAFAVRRWWVLAAGLLVLPLYGERFIEDDPLNLMFTAIVLTPATIGLLAIATGVARATPAKPGRQAGIVAMGVAAALIAVGLYLDWRVVDTSPDDPQTIDALTGAWRGLAIGMRASEVQRTVGPPPAREGVEGTYAPLGMSDADLDGPSTLPARDVWRYEGFALFFAKGQLQGFVTVSESSETREGVGVGDSLEIAERRYRGLRCDALAYGDSSLPELPYCAGLFEENRQIFFAGDPVDSIWVYRDTSLYGRARLAVR